MRYIFKVIRASNVLNVLHSYEFMVFRVMDLHIHFVYAGPRI